MRIRYLTFLFTLLIGITTLGGCSSMKALDQQATAVTNYWKGKTLEEFVKQNPNIDPFQVIDLGLGKKRHMYRYREKLTANEVGAGLLIGADARVYRFIYLFVDEKGVIYDATWERRLIKGN